MSNLFKLGIHMDSSAVFIKWQRLLQPWLAKSKYTPHHFDGIKGHEE